MKGARTWEEVKKRVYTEEQIKEFDAKFEIISAIIEARMKDGITQKKLESMSGVAQPIIARLENGRTVPKLETVIKILSALGKTIKIVDIPKAKV